MQHFYKCKFQLVMKNAAFAVASLNKSSDCGPSTFYCEEHCREIHSCVKYHIPTIWKVEMK